MNRLSSLLLIAFGVIFIGCTKAAYQADATGAANESVNPLNLLTKDEFTWSGTPPLSAKVNGVAFQAQQANFYFGFDTGNNRIYAYRGSDSVGFTLRLKDVYADNVYNFQYGSTLRMGTYRSDSARGPLYYSYLGNVGQVYIVRNDTAAPWTIEGKFHFQALTAINGKLINVSEGYFKFNKF